MHKFVSMLFLLLLSILSTATAYAVDETRYESLLEETVHPWARQFPIQSFDGKNGTDIAYVCYEKPGAESALLVSSGRTESIPKYFEFAYDLFHADLNLSICLFDHRGQGLSERVISDPRKGHVEYYRYYARDLKLMVQKIRSLGYGKVFVLGHSMGGGIATYTAEKHPDLIDGLILTAPMLGMITDPVPVSVAYGLANSMVWFWQGERFIPGKSYWTPTGSQEDFEANYVTRSHARWLMTENLFLRYSQDWPQLPLGGGTARWLREAIRLTWRIERDVDRLRAPILLMQAGEESYVAPAAQEKICRLAADCELISFNQERYRDSQGRLPRHELLMETDNVRDEVLHYLKTFLRTHGVTERETIAQQ